jgi:opacity protein-like surface antigen
VGGFNPFFYTCETDIDWVATAAARLGLTWERALFYVKGGGAWTQSDFTANCIFGPRNGIDGACNSPNGVLATSFGGSTDRFGLLGGFGTEFALTPNWSAKAEYNYIAFDTETIPLFDGSFVRDRTTVSEVKVGVNYHFSPMGGY